VDTRSAGDHAWGRGGVGSATYAIETRERFERPEEYAGYAVCDPLGEKVGSVEELFVNGSGEPEYVKVRMGLLGLRSVLLPVLYVAVDEKRRALLLE
jgi:hypothetical protein